MRTKLFVLLSVGVLMLTASCSRTVKDDAQSHDESLQLTAYNELFEVYAEVTPPVAGDSCEVVGELKAAREKLDGHYRAFITYLC
ncbi:MAG: hypothetical protein IJQ14_05160 [Bacteroidales bacterium]|nr:hypothetical protein [Bacteroidales bacterium]